MNVFNPDNLAAQQYQEHQHKFFALLVYKLAGVNKSIHITEEDMRKFADEKEPLVLITHGHAHSMEFKLMPYKQAVEYERFVNKAQGGLQ